MNEKPIIYCAVKGNLLAGKICSKIIVGMEKCGFDGECIHQRIEPVEVKNDTRN